MATEADLIKNVVWRLLKDRPWTELHTNDPANPATSLTIATGGASRWEAGDYLEWLEDASYDIAQVTAVADTTLTVVAGQLGTTAADHATNARVRKNPTFYGIDAQKAINDVLQELYPENFAVYEATFSPTTTWAAETTLIKEIPLAAEDVLLAYQKSDTGQTERLNVEVSQPFYADSGLTTTGKAIKFSGIPDPNNTIYVQYVRAPGIADLSTGMARAVEYLAAARLLEQEGSFRDRRAPRDGEQQGQQVRDSAYFRRVGEDLLMQERKKLNRRFPKRRKNYLLAAHNGYGVSTSIVHTHPNQ